MAAVELTGFKEFQKMTKEYPEAVIKRISKVGISKAAARSRTILRRASPEDSGLLKKSINVRRAKRGRPLAYIGPTWKSGDNRESYFGRLEWDYDKKYAWFEKAIEAHATEILQIVLTEATSAIYKEAGKNYIKSLRATRK